ncbi:MAG TPA: hypothetical protein VL978_10825 [Puia sp.]|nr:hypothetical protein [Puia sp.]
MKNTFVPVLVLCCLFFSTRAQDRALPGYIVRNSGDTVHGFLREQGSDESAKRISFKASATDNDYQVYSFGEVKSFQYADGNLFRAITYSDTRKEGEPVMRTCYGKLLVSGEFDLYSFTEEDILFFLVRKDTSFYLMFDDDTRSGHEVNGNFRNELNFFAISCDEIKEDAGTVPYAIGPMIRFFQKLDACANPGKAVASYYHRPKGKAGVYAYAGGIPLGNNSQFTAEVRLSMVWPQVNPNMSFNLGFRYVNKYRGKFQDPDYLVATIYNHEAWQIESVPLTIEYTLTHGVVRPFLFAGASLCTLNFTSDNPQLIGDANPVFYHRWAVTPLGGAGIEVRLVRVLWVRAEWRYESMAQYPTVGLALTLP